MAWSIAQHFHRPRELAEHTAVLNDALAGMAESKRNLDAAISERVAVDPFGAFAEAARQSRF